MPTGNSDNAIKFTFDAPNTIPDEATLRAAVAAEGASSGQESVDEASEPATTTPALETAAETTQEAEETSEETGEPAKTPASQELRTFEIVVDGQKLTVTEDDLKAGHMRHRDYTQKTQKIAEKEREFQAKEQAWAAERAAIAQELQAIDQFLRDQAALKTYMDKAFGVAAAPPQIDPNKPLTAADVAEIARYNAEQVRLNMQREVFAARQEAALAAQTEAQRALSAVQREKLEGEIDRHISTILDKYPVLRKFEGIDEELIGDATKLAPKNLEDAKRALVQVAERRVATIKAIAEEEKKAAATAAAKLKKTSPEPPGGQAIKPKPGRKLTLDSSDRKTLLDAGVEDVRAFLNAQQGS